MICIRVFALLGRWRNFHAIVDIPIVCIQCQDRNDEKCLKQPLQLSGAPCPISCEDLLLIYQPGCVFPSPHMEPEKEGGRASPD